MCFLMDYFGGEIRQQSLFNINLINFKQLIRSNLFKTRSLDVKKSFIKSDRHQVNKQSGVNAEE